MKSVAVITGGTKGIGAAIAAELDSRGYQVISSSRNPEKANSSLGKVFPLNVTNSESIDRFFTDVLNECDSIDIFVNNAGVGIFKLIDQLSDSDIDSMIATNLGGAIKASRRALRCMNPIGGRIINIGSVVDQVATPMNAAYGSSKLGLKMLSDVINEEYFSRNIRSTHISLGATWSDIWEGRAGFDKNDMLDPKDVARQIANIAETPLSVRLDHVTIFPSKKVL